MFATSMSILVAFPTVFLSIISNIIQRIILLVQIPRLLRNRFNLNQCSYSGNDGSFNLESRKGFESVEIPVIHSKLILIFNIPKVKQRKSRDTDRPHHVARQQQVDAQLPIKDCWDYYLQVLDDQRSVVAAGEDEKAFIYGLQRFPHLRRVTVTPAAHGHLFSPLYHTPTIRAFPYGFNYPVPWGWHVGQFHSDEGVAPNPLEWPQAREEYKELWRGVRIVLRILSTTVKDHKVSELCFDSSQLQTGINYTVFAEPCEESNNFATIMKRPGFRHLHLAFLVGSEEYYEGFTSGYFSKAVSSAKGLTHIHLTVELEGGTSAGEPHSPIKDIFPIQQWPNLYHFGLSEFSIKISDLIDLLSLAPSIRSFEMGSLKFPHDETNWCALLGRMRDELDWNERDRSLRPTVRIVMEIDQSDPGRFALLTHEVTDLLYDAGEIPTRGMRNFPKLGMGTMNDVFEPEYTRPHIDHRELAKLGIIRPF